MKTKNKLKIAIAMIIIAIIFGLTRQSLSAYKYSGLINELGKLITVKPSEYWSDWSYYCIEEGQEIFTSSANSYSMKVAGLLNYMPNVPGYENVHVFYPEGDTSLAGRDDYAVGTDNWNMMTDLAYVANNYSTGYESTKYQIWKYGPTIIKQMMLDGANYEYSTTHGDYAGEKPTAAMLEYRETAKLYEQLNTQNEDEKLFKVAENVNQVGDKEWETTLVGPVQIGTLSKDILTAEFTSNTTGEQVDVRFFVEENGEYVEKGLNEISNTNVYVGFGNEHIGGNIENITIKFSFGTYNIYGFKIGLLEHVTYPKHQNLITIEGQKNQEPLELELEIPLKKITEVELEILKTGPTTEDGVEGIYLNGVTFEISDTLKDVNAPLVPENTEVTGFAGEDGKLKFYGLEYGKTYYVREISLGSHSDDYVLNPNWIEIATGTGSGTVGEDGILRITKHIINPTTDETVKLKVIKVDATDHSKGLEGITFKLYDAEGTFEEIKTTGENGEVYFSKELVIGKTYYLEEVSLGDLDGLYEKLAEPIEFVAQVTDENEFTVEHHMIVENTPRTGYAQLKVIKKDADDDSITIPGVKFNLYDEEGNFVQEGTTGDDGAVVFIRLEQGKVYYLQEMEITGEYAGKYVIDDTPIKVEIPVGSSLLIELDQVVYNKLKENPKFKIVKRDYDNSNLIVTDITFTLQVVSLDNWEVQEETAFNTTTSEYETRKLYASDLVGAYIKADGSIAWEWNTVSIVAKYYDEIDKEWKEETRLCWNDSSKVILSDSADTSVRLKVDENGELEIELEYKGTYKLKEVLAGTGATDMGYSNDFLMYLKGDETGYSELNIKVDGETNAEYEILNKKFDGLEISGQIWIDVYSGKDSKTDSLMGLNEEDIVNDPMLDGIEVRLVNSEKTVQTTKTSNGGKYVFTDVEIQDVRDGVLRVEFEYNGLEYEAVKFYSYLSDATDEEKELYGSKALEIDRSIFNDKLTTITKGNAVNTGTSVANGNSVPLYYDIDGNKSELTEAYGYLGWGDENSKVPYYSEAKTHLSMNSSTLASLLTEEYYKEVASMTENGIVKITNINFGLTEREQADVALESDLESVRISFNGYSHTYIYGAKNLENATASDFGVLFQSPYTGNYSRPIYEADVTADSDWVTGEFKMDVIYRVAVANETTSLTQIVEEIYNVYDERYEFIDIGLGMTEQGTLEDVIPKNQGYYTENGNTLTMNTAKIWGSDSELKANDAIDLYINVRLTTDNYEEWLDSKEELTNHAEITKYTTLKNGANYAAVDEDSNPGSIYFGVDNYQDDSDKAPGFKVERESDRSISGIVFVDNADTSGAGSIREGNGTLGSEDLERVEGAEVELLLVGPKELTEDQEYITSYTIAGNGETNGNGEFEITDFIAGDYILRYTWGTDNGGLDVRDYKATIFNNTEAEENENTLWFTETGTRNSDAKDDLNNRYEIDHEIKTQVNSIETMISDTLLMTVGVEYGDGTGENISDDEVDPYAITKVDFGIIERAKQSVEIAKKVEKFEIYLQNGVKIVDYDVNNEDNDISGMQIYGTEIKQEMDNEILEGAIVKITYKIELENTGELDYLNLDAESMDVSYSSIILNTTLVDELTDGDRYDNFNDYYTTDYVEAGKIKLDEYYDYYTYGSGRDGATEDKNLIKLSAKVIDVTDGGLGLVDKETDSYDWELISYTDYNSNYMANELTTTEYEEYYFVNDATHEDAYSLETADPAISTARQEEMQATDKAIMYNKALYEATVNNGDDDYIVSYLETSKILSNVDEHKFDNNVEIVRIHQRGGTRVQVNNGEFSSILEDDSETIKITPPTGENRNYTEYVVIGITVTGILMTAAVLIKRRVLDSK